MNITEKRKIEKLITRQVEGARKDLLDKFEADVDAIQVVVPKQLRLLIAEKQRAGKKVDEWNAKIKSLDEKIEKATPDDLIYRHGYRSTPPTFESVEKGRLQSLAAYHSKDDPHLVNAISTVKTPLAVQFTEDDKQLVDFVESKLVASIYLAGDSTALKMLEKMEKALTKIVSGF